jgi:hypothetical protein
MLIFHTRHGKQASKPRRATTLTKNITKEMQLQPSGTAEHARVHGTAG